MQFITPSLQSRIFSATSAHIYIRPHILLQPYIAHYTLHIQEIANLNLVVPSHSLVFLKKNC